MGLLILFFLFNWFLISYNGFNYLGILLLLENFNVFILLYLFYVSSFDYNINFILFIVFATVEVTLGLVILTRVWNSDSLLND
uniref:NADH dehydrogenase subunit 4L n=1 Tax=Lepidotrema longipenis TaxID=330067 RepID=A0A346Q020_9PLAT|nr:NADH dehydrogenase subunit 4L [Lepidotrema longipenis]AXR86346.1 NADH dehydrogenase subunit 4L [Lepidotrema longipenis]